MLFGRMVRRALSRCGGPRLRHGLHRIRMSRRVFVCRHVLPISTIGTGIFDVGIGVGVILSNFADDTTRRRVGRQRDVVELLRRRWRWREEGAPIFGFGPITLQSGVDGMC